MRNRAWAFALLLLFAATYLEKSPGVAAQGHLEGIPLSVGDKVTLVYQQLQPQTMPLTEMCSVAELRGSYVRCAAEKGSRQDEEWRNLAFVVGIAKHAK